MPISNRISSVPLAPIPENVVWPLPRRTNLQVAEGDHSRSFGARRRDGNRTHAGLDLYASYGDPICAIADGVIVYFGHFYEGTYALLVDHGSFVANYGEVDRSSLGVMNLQTPIFKDKIGGRLLFITSSSSTASRYPWVVQQGAAQGPSRGSSVQAGQLIAIVGRMKRSSMLHF